MYRKLLMAGFAAMAIGSSAPSEVLAWGCTAVASDGAYGYSNNYPDEQDAELRALKECDKRTNTNDCQTDHCDPKG